MFEKLLNNFTDENPDLQKQIGCMTGIFQMFDRHHHLTGRHLNGQKHKRIPSGNGLINSSTLQAESNVHSPWMVQEKNLSKSPNENQRVSIESSRVSFSSSSCSSFSSLECNKSTHQAPSSPFERNTYPESSLKNSPTIHYSDINTRSLRSSPCRRDPQNLSAPSTRPSLDFRDVVKGSIYRDTHGLSVKTSLKEKVKKTVMKHQESPRPFPLSKSMEGSYVIGINEKPKVSVDINESHRVLTKLKEAPWFFSEDKEPPRTSYEGKYVSSFNSVHKEAPRYSYDGREISRLSLDSRENSKCSAKFRELPRLSLDSRQGSMSSSNSDSRSNSLLKDLERNDAKQRTSRALSLQKELESHKQSHSVVARLMGLEAMPNSSSGMPNQLGLTRRCTDRDDTSVISFEDQGTNKFISRSSLKMPEESKQDRLSCSPKSSLKGSIIPRSKTPDPVIKPNSKYSRLPIETAPWRQQQGKEHSTKKTAAFSIREAYTTQQPESVYNEIAKILKDVDIQKSNKDPRALKQILDAIQAKGLLETKKGEDQASEVSSSGKNYNAHQPATRQNSRFCNRQNTWRTHSVPTLIKGDNTPRPLDSPIVIMKPAKFVNRSSVTASSSIISFDGLSGLQKVRTTCHAIDMKRISSNNQSAKEQTPYKLSNRDSPANQILYSADKKPNKQTERNSPQKPPLQRLQSSSRPQQTTMENSGSSVKSSSSLSPRLQQKRYELEKKSRPHVPSSDSGKSRRQATTKPSELVSPRCKLRPKPTQAQKNDDQLSEMSSETRNLSHHGDEISLRSNSNISLASLVDVEVTSADQSSELNSIFIQQGSRRPPERSLNNRASIFKEKSSRSLNYEDTSSAENETITPEQPSPISVLDASFYKDDLPPSPVNKVSNLFQGHENQNCDAIPGGEEERKAVVDSGSRSLDILRCDSSSSNTVLKHKKKLKNVEGLLQQLSSSSSKTDDGQDDEAVAPTTTTTMDHIASLCESQSPDHRYVSEILLASGLLLPPRGDLGATPPMGGTTTTSRGAIQLHQHPSGYPIINPELFLILEQTKSSSPLLNNKLKPAAPGGTTQSKKAEDPKRLHRKLMFDTVNEVLVQKLDLLGSSYGPGINPRPRRTTTSLCSVTCCSGLLTRDDARIPSGRQLLRELCLEVDRLQANGGGDDEDDDDSLMSILRADVERRSEVGWTDFSREVSGLVLDVERSIFKDLIDEVVHAGDGPPPSAKPTRRRRQQPFA